MKHTITVNDSFEFELSEDQATTLDSAKLDTSKSHILHHGKSYDAQIITSDVLNRRYVVKINNVAHTVSISREIDRLIKEMGFETGTNKRIDAIKAPMPGLILEINVVVGQQVAINDPMLILSAMKMENSFVSPRDGVIKAIHAKPGDAVDKGQLLIEFE